MVIETPFPTREGAGTGHSPYSPLPQVKKITRKRPLTNETLVRWSLPLVLAFQALFSWVLLQNTAFQDEALYVYAGRQIWQGWLSGHPFHEYYSVYFSGNPYIFPIIAGGLDLLGGLELVRFFCLLCLLTVTACGYYVTKQLFNQRSAIFAAIFFVCQGPVLFLGRLATYDALCLCMLAVATALAVKAGQARRPWWALGLGPFLVLAFFAKYAALLFVPSILVILALWALSNGGWRSLLARSALGVFSLGVVATLAAQLVIRFDPQMLHALGATTTNRMVIASFPRPWLTQHVIEMVGLSYGMGLIGLLFARQKQVFMAFLFLGTALLIPAYHIYATEIVSLDKHLGFSMFYVMPVAGHALASLSGFRTGLQRTFSASRYWLSGVAIYLILFLIGVHEAQVMYYIWPSTTQVTWVFDTQVRLANGRYLAEQVEVLRYNLRDGTYDWQWVGLDYFEYTDAQGHYLTGKEAYVKAVNDGYFDLIQLNYGYNKQIANLITTAIKQSKKYELIKKMPAPNVYGNSDSFWIWRKY